MTQKEYLWALSVLELKPASMFTSEVLGVSLRQLMRYSSGEDPISKPVELLLQIYIAYGLRPDRPRKPRRKRRSMR